MEFATFLIDFILHVDKHLEAFVTSYGAWVYALLFLIIFVETGVVVMPFLPGDSLLFVVGAMCGVGLMSYPLAVGLLFAAAVLGDQCNYTIGRYIGPKVFQWEDSRLFNKRAFNQAHAFYEKYGGVTIIIARFMPFLPGDSLLFIVGALCGADLMSFPLAVGLLLVAAVLGDQCNYSIGRYFGPKVFQWENSRWFNRRAFDQAHAFYERYGGITIVIARFMPFIRTFAPFVAGVAAMGRGKFTAFNIGGAILWVVGICTAGYFFGNLPWVRQHLDKIIWALILVPGLIAIFGAWRAGKADKANKAAV